MFTNLPNSKLSTSLDLNSEALEDLAAQTKFVQRRNSRFSASGFILGLLKSVTSGCASLQDLASIMDVDHNSSLSKQALHQRMNERALEFVKKVIQQAISRKLPSLQMISSKGFNRILVQDASSEKIHNAHAHQYVSSGCKSSSLAGFKLDLGVDLVSGSVYSSRLVSSVRNDKTSGDLLMDEVVSEGDLLLRDLGYYKQDAFIEAANKGAFLISRIPTNVRATDCETGRCINHILSNTTDDKLTLDVYISSWLEPVRLVATRATPEQAKQKRHKAAVATNRQKKKKSANADLRNDWHILVTNVPSSILSDEEVVALYQARWQIEIIFKAWKQSWNPEKSLRYQRNPWHMECLIHASLLWLILTLQTTVVQQCQRPSRELSVVRVAKALYHHLLRCQYFDDLFVFRPDIRSIRSAPRSRKSLISTLASALS